MTASTAARATTRSSAEPVTTPSTAGPGPTPSYSPRATGTTRSRISRTGRTPSISPPSPPSKGFSISRSRRTATTRRSTSPNGAGARSYSRTSLRPTWTPRTSIFRCEIKDFSSCFGKWKRDSSRKVSLPCNLNESGFVKTSAHPGGFLSGYCPKPHSQAVAEPRHGALLCELPLRVAPRHGGRAPASRGLHLGEGGACARDTLRAAPAQAVSADPAVHPCGAPPPGDDAPDAPVLQAPAPHPAPLVHGPEERPLRETRARQPGPDRLHRRFSQKLHHVLIWSLFVLPRRMDTVCSSRSTSWTSRAATSDTRSRASLATARMAAPRRASAATPRAVIGRDVRWRLARFVAGVRRKSTWSGGIRRINIIKPKKK